MHLEEKLANNARARVYWCGAFARLFIKLRARASALIYSAELGSLLYA